MLTMKYQLEMSPNLSVDLPLKYSIPVLYTCTHFTENVL